MGLTVTKQPENHLEKVRNFKFSYKSAFSRKSVNQNKTLYLQRHSYMLLNLLRKQTSQSKNTKMSVKAEIDQLIKQYPVFMISKTYCPFCTMAKDALKNYAIPADKIKIMEIENHKDCAEIQNYMSQLTGGRTVPRVFIGGECIGGGSEASAMQQSGELEKRIQSALSS